MSKRIEFHFNAKKALEVIFSRSQIPFGNAFPQRSALYTSDMTLRVMEGIPKQSLGTRNTLSKHD